MSAQQTIASAVAWLDQFGQSVADEEALAAYVAIVFDQEYTELWLQHTSSGESLCLLVNPDALACLLYQRGRGDEGSRSHNPDQPEGSVVFELANGQRDNYPAHWAIERDTAIHAFIHFFRTGQLADYVVWSSEP